MDGVKEFKREARYIVIKLADLNKLRGGQTEALRQELAAVSRRLPKRECVVVESDWPEYNFVWLMIEHRMGGYPVPDFNAVKCAADVQVAQSELAALREELAMLKQEAWEAAGGNPGIKATRDELLSALRLMNEADDEHDAMQQRLTAAENELAELQTTIARLTAENERLKGGQGEAVAYRWRVKGNDNWSASVCKVEFDARANDDRFVAQKLYTSPPAPVAVVLPERAEFEALQERFDKLTEKHNAMRTFMRRQSKTSKGRLQHIRTLTKELNQ